MKTKTSFTTNSMNRSPLRRGLFLTALVLACFALSPQARAVCQDACLTNNNTVQGDGALISLTTGVNNTAIGFDALGSLTIGPDNTAIGIDALASMTATNGNTAVGARALQFNTGAQNTAIGIDALQFNTKDNNTAIGGGALGLNTTGVNNTATGSFALELNTTGSNNTANGLEALFSNTTGSSNIATGYFALDHNTTGSENTANGANALFTNKTGSQNTADGSGALFMNRFGNFNTGVGRNALYNNKTGASNVALGNNAGFNITGSQNIDIGNDGVGGESGTIRIGNPNSARSFIAGIVGAGPFSSTVTIDPATGQLGEMVSSARFKKDIDAMDKASEAIFSLKPVTFHYKNDKTSTAQFGLVAEQVAEVNRALIGVDKAGKPYTVRYEAVNAMLLNEFLKEHAKVEQLKKDFESRSAEQQKQIEALTVGLQKVSAQLEANKPAPQVVNNP